MPSQKYVYLHIETEVRSRHIQVYRKETPVSTSLVAFTAHKYSRSNGVRDTKVQQGSGKTEFSPGMGLIIGYPDGMYE